MKLGKEKIPSTKIKYRKESESFNGKFRKK
jgi:hypothetical protein